MTGTKGMGRHKVTDSQSKPSQFKLVEGSQTSLSKLIIEMHGLKTFEIILLSKYRVYNVYVINFFLITVYKIALNLKV